MSQRQYQLTVCLTHTTGTHVPCSLYAHLEYKDMANDSNRWKSSADIRRLLLWRKSSFSNDWWHISNCLSTLLYRFTVRSTPQWSALPLGQLSWDNSCKEMYEHQSRSAETDDCQLLHHGERGMSLCRLFPEWCMCPLLPPSQYSDCVVPLSQLNKGSALPSGDLLLLAL